MDRYALHEQLGAGAFGVVSRATKIATGEMVAIKRSLTVFESWNEVRYLREFRASLAFSRKPHHSSFVQVFDIIRENDGALYFVMELMEGGSLLDFLAHQHRMQVAPCESQIHEWMYQLLDGLTAMHGQGWTHRDIKPENLLFADHGRRQLKIADLGLARRVQEPDRCTSYIGTLWYRAPEAMIPGIDHPMVGGPLIQASPAIDVFAAGLVAAELFRGGVPLLAGKTEVDQMHMVVQLLGPLETQWPDAIQVFHEAVAGPVTLQVDNGCSVSERLFRCIPRASCQVVEWIAGMLQLNPNNRWAAAEACAVLEDLFSESAVAPVDTMQASSFSHTPRKALPEYEPSWSQHDAVAVTPPFREVSVAFS